MPVTGRKPKPPGQSRTRVKPVHEWTEVPDVPYRGAPGLPRPKSDWPAPTCRWWAAVSTMPHCVLWTASDWQFALDSALVAARFHGGSTAAATELRNREKVLGTTVDFRRDLRIRYVPPVDETLVTDDRVARLNDYRDL